MWGGIAQEGKVSGVGCRVSGHVLSGEWLATCTQGGGRQECLSRSETGLERGKNEGTSPEVDENKGVLDDIMSTTLRSL